MTMIEKMDKLMAELDEAEKCAESIREILRGHNAKADQLTENVNGAIDELRQALGYHIYMCGEGQ